ncbi:cytochrome-c peroxidase [Paremcibacter congregatus]|uniref:Methylamine utilization protein MauG n=1 Tax=Paremcibacter congregatus TaxID=2043170 RepID=A0A2G4YTY4_9PROT|nr:cytochrome c peroxidase [Paremcibacter congregatus]PHZ85801.1 cytochrome-c peroxidase [Paremcibacter congregatus]QDE26764.1 cytochrome-c peroxidase [Paremcibacter congregatus]
MMRQREIIIAVGIFMVLLVSKSHAAEPGISLREYCPPGFELSDQNKCLSRNLYQLYRSPQKAGLGGLKIDLPKARDGFSPQQIDLGRYLFFDPVLSGDGTLSCASCHDPDQGFSDGKGRSDGHNGEKLTRSAPTLWNVAYLKKFYWDGRADTLEEQMQGPLYAENEMANTPENLLENLNDIPVYRDLFQQAFPENRQEDITLADIYQALAAFESSLISLNSRYDRYAHGYHDALTDQEKEGLNIFRSFVARCAECHTPPLFTNQQIAVIGTPEVEGMPRDVGAEAVLDDPDFRGGFKVPTLRNIARTAPYMHSGRFKTLRETVEFYTKGRGHALGKDEKLILHWHIWEPNLADHELDRLVDFLHTLTDEVFTPQVPERVPSQSQAQHKSHINREETP